MHKGNNSNAQHAANLILEELTERCGFSDNVWALDPETYKELHQALVQRVLEGAAAVGAPEDSEFHPSKWTAPPISERHGK